MRYPYKWMRGLRRKMILLAILLIGLPAMVDAVNGFAKASGGCAVWRVIDGDTVAMRCPDGFVRLRIAEIDTPERSAGCWSEAWRAVAATQRLRWAFLRAGQIDLPRDGPLDRYGRRLGAAFVDGQPVAAQMLDARLAVPYVAGDITWCDRIERGMI